MPSLIARCVLAAALSLTTLPALAATGHWQTQAEGVARAVDAAEAAFAKGDADAAKLDDAKVHPDVYEVNQ